jgi:S1-C subfamily serine protease
MSSKSEKKNLQAVTGATLLALAAAFCPLQGIAAADPDVDLTDLPEMTVSAGGNDLIAARPANTGTPRNTRTAASGKDGDEAGQVFASAPPAPVTPEEVVNIRLYKTVSPAVVNVTTSKITPEMIMWGLTPPSDTGSGSIISPDGYILTNNHVIAGASIVRVTIYDGTQFMATVVGADPQNDLAVLKIDAGKRKLTAVKLGDSSKLEVGRRIYTIGNPFGLDLTMTSGIISSVGRTLKTESGHVIKGILQTDAAINPGNSGGPLLDTQGNMIGVTTAILSKVAQSAGIGFAIPINIVKRIVPQIIAHGAILRPDLGIMQVRVVPGSGLMVASLDPAGPAAEAGLRGPAKRTETKGPWTITQIDNSAADIIVGIDSQRIATVDDLLSYLETKKPGQVVTLNVIRQGLKEVARIPVKLGETKTQP